MTVSPGQYIYYVKPGDDVTIVWTITGANISDFASRSWSFIPTNELLASMSFDGSVIIRNTSLKSGITITKPSTMTLTDVDMKYDGTYEFAAQVDSNLYTSSVHVFVLSKCL